MLMAPTLHLLVTIASHFNLIIGISDVTNAFQNTLKDVYEREVIDLPPHYLDWFKLRYAKIKIAPASDGRYVTEICRGMQGTKPAGRLWNTLLDRVFQSLGLVRHIVDQALYIYAANEEVLLVWLLN